MYSGSLEQDILGLEVLVSLYVLHRTAPHAAKTAAAQQLARIATEPE